MTRTLITALALSAATPTIAQSTDTGLQMIDIAGVANPACLMRGPAPTSGVNARFQTVSASLGDIQIVELVNPQTAVPRATSISIAMPVICNSAHRLSILSRSGGLKRVAANERNQASGGFADFLPYALSADWAGQSLTQSSEVRGGINISTANAGAGNMTIGFSVGAGNTPLVAGAYTDAITIEFRAAN
jgi:spore coat protein U-like protein